ncbi:MAG TPA: cytochrome c3 family protein [Thermoanaerobaculia bacterium]|nr:cytochrome c3 family protein [Thermoanaerobaculia bacterium]
MSQIFPRSANQVSAVTLILLLSFAVAAGAALWMLDRSPFHTRQGQYVTQPVKFSHDHHTEGLGIDCRYCHTSVEESSFAGIPPTATCMNCHSQVWANTEMLAPVRDSWQSGQPLQWTRVNDLPDYVYFDHSIHLAKGMGCRTCHGPVDQMPLMYQEASLQMRWCLECHRNPERFVRPRDRVVDMSWTPAAVGTTQAELGPQLIEEYGIPQDGSLESCSVCHR